MTDDQLLFETIKGLREDTKEGNHKIDSLRSDVDTKLSALGKQVNDIGHQVTILETRNVESAIQGLRTEINELKNWKIAVEGMINTGRGAFSTVKVLYALILALFLVFFAAFVKWLFGS